MFANWALSNSPQLVLQVVGISLRVLLIAILVWGALAILRVRNPAIRHRAWTIVLLGMIVIPVLVICLPGWNLPLERPDWGARATSHGNPAASKTTTTKRFSDRVSPVDNAAAEHELFGQSSSASNASLGQQSSTEMSAKGDTAKKPIRPTVGSAPANSPKASAVGASSSVWPIIASTLFIVYLLVAVALLLRLLLGLATVRRLARGSHLLETVDGIPVQVSAAIAVPVTVGTWRPQVLVPACWCDWSDAKRDAVLKHELEHIARRDYLTTLIAEINICLFWFHPISWLLSRTLSRLAEQCCDDAVLWALPERSAYARFLLEIAATVTSRQAKASRLLVAMARKSQVANRINQILDSHRALAQRPGGREFAIVFAAVSSCVLAVGIARAHTEPELHDSTAIPSASGNQEVDNARAKSEIANKQDNSAADQLPVEEIIKAKIVDENGNPIDGAEVFVTSPQSNINPSDMPVFARATSDDEGDVEIPLVKLDAWRSPPGRLFNFSGLEDMSRDIVILAPEYIPSRPFLSRLKQEKRVVMKQAEIPIVGRIVDQQGDPVAGVRVRVERIQPARDGVEQWIAASRDNPPSISSDDAVNLPSFPEALPVFLSGLPAPQLSATTGPDGRFRLDGFPKDALVYLTVDGAEIAKSRVNVLTREVQPFNMPDGWPTNRSQKCFGATFEYVAELSQPIVGVVRDADTQAPIPHAVVAINSFKENEMRGFSGNGFVQTTTNEQGEYRLTGLPQLSPAGSRAYELEVAPHSETPYFRRPRIRVPKQAEAGPIQLDIELKRGIWITGKLLDGDTGQPVQGIVGYYPLHENKSIDEFPNFRRSMNSSVPDSYATAPDGSFRIPAIPGRGVLAGTGLEVNHYRVAAGAAEMGWPTGKTEHGRDAQEHFAIYLRSPRVVHTVDLVDLAPGTEMIQQDITLIPLERQTVEIVDPQGEPVSETYVSGTHPFFMLGGQRFTPGWRLFTNFQHVAVVDIFGLEFEQKRRIAVLHIDRRLGAAAWLEHAKNSQVELQPLATFRGRVLGETGQPLGGVQFELRIPSEELPLIGPYQFGQAWANQQLEVIATDEHGQFELTRVIPGLRLQLQRYDYDSIDLEPAAPGEVRDLGDLTFMPDTKR